MKLCVSFNFIRSEFHGKGDGGVLEWPPSPLRVFQALISSAASQGSLIDSLGCLVNKNPIIIAPKVKECVGYCISVPNNQMDIAAKRWVKGEKGGEDKFRMLKDVRYNHIFDSKIVYYIYDYEDKEISKELFNIVRGVSCLGWGIDMVLGECKLIESEDEVEGIRWYPGERGSNKLRVPRDGIFDSLEKQYSSFISCYRDKKYFVDSLKGGFEEISYSQSKRGVSSYAFFEFRDIDNKFKVFDKKDAVKVSGMVRNLFKRIAEKQGKDKDWISKIILGHGEKVGCEYSPVSNRFYFIPVNTISYYNGEKVEDIRRMLVYSDSETCEDDIEWAKKFISGNNLINEQGQKECIVLEEEKNKIEKRYVGEGLVWETVTPVILPGYDDPRHYREKMKKGAGSVEKMMEKIDKKIGKMLIKCFGDSGFSEDMIKSIDWQKIGFVAGVDRADNYEGTSKLKFPRYHVRIEFKNKVKGPVCIGSGRYKGLGVMICER